MNQPKFQKENKKLFISNENFKELNIRKVSARNCESVIDIIDFSIIRNNISTQTKKQYSITFKNNKNTLNFQLIPTTPKQHKFSREPESLNGINMYTNSHT